MKLSDEVIGHIAKSLQLAILTGTDIIDHLRMIILENDGNNTLVLEEEYAKVCEENIDRMLTELSEKTAEA
jgi:hypothetical protein